MTATRTTIFGALALAATMGVLALPASAEDRGSMDDQMACTPDVYKFCSSFIPDEDAIVSCLKQHIQTLSPGCHQVFTRPSQPDDNSNSE